jgi:hypothetical protein
VIGFQQIGYMGRLGNQMFQFASTLGIANRLGLEARFPIENCFKLQGSGPFDPKLGRNMLVKCDLLDCFDIDPVYFIPERHLVLDKVYHEPVFEYDAGTQKMEDGTNLYGYLQTEKYFLDARDLILHQFAFKAHIRQSAEFYMENIRSTNKVSQIVSIHVRRGDYVMFPDHHPTCSKEYYDKAINTIKNMLGKDSDIKFLVFSDDIEWCSGQFVGDEYRVVDMNNPFSEMCLMTMCDHNIIANSSFSWWGAWLGDSSDRIVISPSKWFGHLIQKNTSDIYLKNWIKI